MALDVIKNIKVKGRSHKVVLVQTKQFHQLEWWTWPMIIIYDTKAAVDLI